MQTITLSGSNRENVGRSDAKATRKAGMVPCIVYGGTNQISFSVNEKALNKIVFSPFVYLIHLNINGEEKKVLIKDTQFHPVNDRVIHVDFIELLPGKMVKIALPLKVEGNSLGVAKGGAKIVHFRKIRLMASLETLVDAITCNISSLEIGDKIRVKDLEANGLTILEEPNAVVVAIESSRASRKATEEAATKEEKGAKAKK